jgi:hypothetical protein
VASVARPAKNYQEVLRSYPRSRKVNSVSIGAECLYLRLLVLADCAGRFPAEPLIVAGLALAERLGRGDVTGPDVARWLDELEAAALIGRYEVSGERLLELQNYYRTANNRVVATYPERPDTPCPQPTDTPCPPSGDEGGPPIGDSPETETETETTTERAGARVVVVGSFPWPEWVGVSNRTRWVQEITDACFSFVDVRSADCYLDGVCQAICQVTAPRPSEGPLDRMVREDGLDVVGDVVAWLRSLDGKGRAICTGALRKGPLAALWRHPRLQRDDERNQRARERREGGVNGKA